MLLLLSPAKKLDYDSPVRTTLHTQPLFIKQAAGLIDVLKKKSATEIASLMKLSDALAELNVDRYSAWKPKFTQTNSRQAVLAFNGDVNEGLEPPLFQTRNSSGRKSTWPFSAACMGCCDLWISCSRTAWKWEHDWSLTVARRYTITGERRSQIISTRDLKRRRSPGY